MTRDSAAKIFNDFRNSFSFLENEFACIIVEEKYPQSNLDKSVLIYQNKFVRVELAGDEPYYFHAEIRRIVDGEVTSYADKKNNVGFSNYFPRAWRAEKQITIPKRNVTGAAKS